MLDETLKREQLQLEELPNPQIQEPDDVIVRVAKPDCVGRILHRRRHLALQSRPPLPIFSATRTPGGFRR
jgi:hypothetical protein